jgi:hypothetical protein
MATIMGRRKKLGNKIVKKCPKTSSREKTASNTYREGVLRGS